MSKRFGTVRGFTLIELMIVVAIVGILAAIAYPSYTESVRKGKRAEAKAALMEGAQALERYYSVNGTYLKLGAVADVFPVRVPAAGTANYTMAAAGTRNSFTLTATAVNSMSTDTRCGNFTLTHTGVRNVSVANAAVACW